MTDKIKLEKISNQVVTKTQISKTQSNEDPKPMRELPVIAGKDITITINPEEIITDYGQSAIRPIVLAHQRKNHKDFDKLTDHAVAVKITGHFETTVQEKDIANVRLKLFGEPVKPIKNLKPCNEPMAPKQPQYP